MHDATYKDDLPELAKKNTALTEDDYSAIGLSQSDSRSEPDTIRTTQLEEDSETRLCDHAFKRPHREESDKLVARPTIGPLLLFLSTSLCILIVVGCILPSFSVVVLGIVGVLVESGQAFIAANTNYSVFTTIKLLFDQASLTGGVGDYVGLGTLSVILVVSVLIIPVLQSLVLLVQWFVPLTRKRRYRLLVALEILQAW